MKGSAFVLLGCFALFFAAPSRSYSISEDDQLANRQDTQSGSPSTATSGGAGESRTIKIIGDANPGNESVAGDAQAKKSKIRKRDTRSLVRDETDTEETTTYPPIPKDYALHLFRQLEKYGSKCFGQAFDYIEEHELPVGFVEDFFPEAKFTHSHMMKWLRIIKDNVSECLVNSTDQFLSENVWYRSNTLDYEEESISDLDTFDHVSEFLSPFIYIGRALKKCLEDAITYLEETLYGPVNPVKFSLESLSDLLTELIEELSLIEERITAAGGTAPMSAPYLNSAPVTTTNKKRNSLDKPRGYPRYSNLPELMHSRYKYTKDIPNSIAPQFSRFRGQAAQIPYATGITSLPGDFYAHPTQQWSLLDVVLDKIYSKLQGKVPPPVNMEAAPAGLRVDANGALGLHHGNGESPAMGNQGFNPECSHKRVQ